MSYRIEVFTEHNAVALRAEGRFDLSLGFALWQFCRPEEGRYRYYLLDFACVSELCDSGVGWLRDFCRWAKEADASVHAVNVRPEHRQGCIDSGIPVYMPGDDPVFLRFDQARGEAIATPLPLGIP